MTPTPDLRKALEPCPFCGSRELDDRGEYISCTNCEADGPFVRDDTARQRWNTRAYHALGDDAAIERMLRAMSDALRTECTKFDGQCYAHGFSGFCPQEGGWSGEVDGEFDLELLARAALAALHSPQDAEG